MPQKVSLTLEGKKTSLSIEPEFWALFRKMAARERIKPPQLVRRIRREGIDKNLSRAVRLAVLRDLVQTLAKNGGALP